MSCPWELENFDRLISLVVCREIDLKMTQMVWWYLVYSENSRVFSRRFCDCLALLCARAWFLSRPEWWCRRRSGEERLQTTSTTPSWRGGDVRSWFASHRRSQKASNYLHDKRGRNRLAGVKWKVGSGRWCGVGRPRYWSACEGWSHPTTPYPLPLANPSPLLAPRHIRRLDLKN